MVGWRFHFYTLHRIEDRGAKAQSLLMPKRILVVDDSALVVRSLKSSLESIPDWIVGGEAANGREAIEKVQRLNPDLVVIDLSMPVMNGIEAAHELSRIRPDLPVVMFTNTPEIAKESLPLGCWSVVAKTEVSRLIEVISDIFENAA